MYLLWKHVLDFESPELYHNFFEALIKYKGGLPCYEALTGLSFYVLPLDINGIKTENHVTLIPPDLDCDFSKNHGYQGSKLVLTDKDPESLGDLINKQMVIEVTHDILKVGKELSQKIKELKKKNIKVDKEQKKKLTNELINQKIITMIENKIINYFNQNIKKLRAQKTYS